MKSKNSAYIHSGYKRIKNNENIRLYRCWQQCKMNFSLIHKTDYLKELLGFRSIPTTICQWDLLLLESALANSLIHKIVSTRNWNCIDSSGQIRTVQRQLWRQRTRTTTDINLLSISPNAWQSRHVGGVPWKLENIVAYIQSLYGITFMVLKQNYLLFDYLNNINDN